MIDGAATSIIANKTSFGKQKMENGGHVIEVWRTGQRFMFLFNQRDLVIFQSNDEKPKCSLDFVGLLSL